MVRSRGFLRALRVALAALVLAGFLFALATQAQSLKDYTWHVEPMYLLVAALLALGRGAALVYPWWRIVTSWGYSLPWKRAIRLYFLSGLARYLPGQWWFVMGRAYLAEREGVRKAVTAASTAVETVMLVGSALALALLGISTVPRWASIVPPLAMALGTAGAIGLLLSPPFVSWLANIGLRLARAEPVPATLSAWDTLLVTFGCLANWIIYGLVSAFLVAGISGTEYLAEAPAIIGIFAASVLGGSLTLVIPQGLVIREGVLVYLLHALLDVPLPAAIAVAALARLFSMGSEGLWALASLGVRRQPRNGQSSVRTEGGR